MNDIVMITLAGLGGFGALAWIAAGVMFTITMRRLPRLPTNLDASVPLPSLSVVIPACNEADTIEEALKSVVASEYPGLQVIVVNDRSTDNTGEIVERLAKENPRITAVHIDALPEGWLGKTHALAKGAEHATGDWILYTDADVHYTPDVLAHALRYAEQHKLDHMALMPHLRSHGMLQEAALMAFGGMFLITTRASKVSDPDADAYAASGAFNLVRRSKFAQSDGWQWLRLEVADDVGLAYLMHRAGARSAFLLALDNLHISWYDSLGQMVRGLEKNLFAVIGHYSWPTTLLRAAAVCGFVLAPALTFLPLGVPYLWLAGIAALISHLSVSINGARTMNRRWLPFLFVPMGQLLISYMLIRSAWITTRQGGVRWRGTFYSLKALRAGRRLDI